MVTGASIADLVSILIDARKGVLEQSRRHAFIAGLLGIPHLVLCVNKMDLVGWSEEIRDEFRRFAMKLDVPDLTFVPMSALHGDNIVHRSASIPWYEGTSLLHHLEEVHIASTVRAIWGPGGEPVAEAFPPAAVTLQLADDLDVSRGDLICRPGNRPHVGHDVDAMLCRLTEQSALTPGAKYTIRHISSTTKARVRELDYRLDVNTLHRDESAESLSLNEIGRSGCAPSSRCFSIPTAATGTPAASSSSTKPPATPWPRA